MSKNEESSNYSSFVDKIGENIEFNRDFGIWIQNERIKRKLDIEKIANITFIGRKYIRAIENGDTETLSNKAFRVMYINKYLNTLNLTYKDFSSCQFDTNNKGSVNLDNKVRKPSIKSRSYNVITLFIFTILSIFALGAIYYIHFMLIE